MPRKSSLDAKDIQILNILKFDASINNKQLSEKIEMSPSQTLQRVNKLREDGYIKSIKARINYTKFGYTYHTVVIVKLPSKFLEDFKKKIICVANVSFCAEVKQKKFTDYSSMICNIITTSEQEFVEIASGLYADLDYNVDFEIVNIEDMIVDSDSIKLELK